MHPTPRPLLGQKRHLQRVRLLGPRRFATTLRDVSCSRSPYDQGWGTPLHLATAPQDGIENGAATRDPARAPPVRSRIDVALPVQRTPLPATGRMGGNSRVGTSANASSISSASDRGDRACAASWDARAAAAEAEASSDERGRGASWT